mgnify:CR=1 FL=1
MKGDPAIIRLLNAVLTNELTAVNQYFLHARMYQDWGFTKLFDRINHEMEEETEHADALLKRILAGQNPASIVLGWHSYAKDTEAQHTTLTGNYGLKMEGLHNLAAQATVSGPTTSDASPYVFVVLQRPWA